MEDNRAVHSLLWSPLLVPVFRVLWIAWIVANLGVWMQNVSGVWLMTTLSPDRHGADLALAEGLDPSEAPRVAGLSAGDHHEPFWLALLTMHRPCTNASLAISSSRICSWMNCAPGFGAPHRCSGSGWPSTPARSFCPCCISAPARNTRRIGLSTHCESSWLLVASPSSAVMASISPSMPSRLISDSGSKWFVEDGTCLSDRWQQS